MLRILGDLEEGNKDRLLPMAPEFVELLETAPEEVLTAAIPWDEHQKATAPQREPADSAS